MRNEQKAGQKSHQPVVIKKDGQPKDRQRGKNMKNNIAEMISPNIKFPKRIIHHVGDHLRWTEKIVFFSNTDAKLGSCIGGKHPWEIRPITDIGIIPH